METVYASRPFFFPLSLLNFILPFVFLLELCRQSLSEDSVSYWCCYGKFALHQHEWGWGHAVNNHIGQSQCTVLTQQDLPLLLVPTCEAGAAIVAVAEVQHSKLFAAVFLVLLPVLVQAVWIQFEISLCPIYAVYEHAEWVMGNLGDLYSLLLLQAEGQVQYTN